MYLSVTVSELDDDAVASVAVATLSLSPKNDHNDRLIRFNEPLT